ncbi:oligosaccharide repeat unit polymerase [Clostridium algoriphilum]|uniref:O-antigen ligase family protein n=1 Tax=Clostridium algoriphilum TaxID=198347 RepID=UPI001CF52ED8|nr:O-antigen ligase family protein [Clostridium algoriphilum]MCB2295314.1 oligosaccharide repeat unit polymerase [Clostridium algoriphilum]
MLISKLQDKLIILFVVLFAFILCFFTIYSKLIILFGACLFVFVDILLRKRFEFKIELRIIFYLLISFVVLEFILQQNDTWITTQTRASIVEIMILFFLIGFALIKNENWFTKEFKIITLILIGFIFCNFISTMQHYHSLKIFITSTLDYCKYFGLIYFIMLSKVDEDDILKLLKVFSLFIIVCTILSFLQLLGNIQLFDLFRGRFDIVSRNGNYRSIGFFPYPIELGNYAAILFCLYYYLNKYIYKNIWFYFISLLLVINVVLSGTRIALVALILVFIFSNLKSVRQILSTAIIIVVASLVLNNFMNIQQMINDTKQEYVGMTPREYYILNGINVWKDNPLVGIGFGTYGSMKYRMITGDKIFNEYKLHAFDFAKLQTTDTFVAEILPEFGTLGIVLLFLFGGLFYSRYKIIEKYNKGNRAYVYVFFTICILSLNSSSVFFSSHIGTFFWISMGMILNNYLLLTENEKQQLNNDLTT